MAQTTNAMSMVDALIEFSTNGSSWVDISGFANEIGPADSARNLGEAYTADGDIAIQTAGKRTPFDIVVRIVFTDQTSTSDPFYTVLTQHQTAGGGAMYLRWSPGGGDSNELQFTTPSSFVSNLQFPGGPVETGEPITVTFTVRVTTVTAAQV